MTIVIQIISNLIPPTREYEVVALLTTVNKDTQLSTMHNIPIELLQAQSKSIGIPLHIIGLKPQGNLDDYSATMADAAIQFKEQGITHFVFGDIYLHDIRKYREVLLHSLGIEVVEPLWDMSSQEAIESYLESGLQTVIVTTEANGLGIKTIGRIIDSTFINQLASDIDPNGENGEYHTFCYDGPIFSSPIAFELGIPIEKSYDIRLEDGTIKNYTYCFANLKAKI